MTVSDKQGARSNGPASPALSQAEIFGQPGLSQAELFGLPTSSTYVGGRGQHRGRRPSMPAWYAKLCEGWSRAVWHGELRWERAAALVELWHPVALQQALTPGSKRRLDRTQQLELEKHQLELGLHAGRRPAGRGTT